MVFGDDLLDAHQAHLLAGFLVLDVQSFDHVFCRLLIRLQPVVANRIHAVPVFREVLELGTLFRDRLAAFLRAGVGRPVVGRLGAEHGLERPFRAVGVGFDPSPLVLTHILWLVQLLLEPR
jgi:hypothetical protein